MNPKDPPSLYDPQRVEAYFDGYGEREWQRLVASPVHEISLAIHLSHLNRFISSGQRVLEIGAGAGRFTQALAAAGARVVAADISGGQLELNRQHARELGFSGAVEDWAQVDICDLSRFPENSFDAVVAYGGPFSYVLDRRDQALAECRRVLRPGGPLLLSVMCLWGSASWNLEGVLMGTPVEANRRITTTGDISPATFPERRDNFMHLFRSSELRDWLESRGWQVLALSASNSLARPRDDAWLAAARADPERWAELLRIELEASAEPGCLDMGTHLIAAARKPAE